MSKQRSVISMFAILSHLELGKDALAWDVCVHFLWTPCHPYYSAGPSGCGALSCCHFSGCYRFLWNIPMSLHCSVTDILNLFCSKCSIFLLALLWPGQPSALSWATAPQHSLYPAMLGSSGLLDQAKRSGHLQVSFHLLDALPWILTWWLPCHPGLAQSPLCRAGFLTPSLKQQAVFLPTLCSLFLSSILYIYVSLSHIALFFHVFFYV